MPGSPCWPTPPRPLKFRDPVHFYLGTARVVGIVALLDRDQLEPGESALVQIHLDRPLVAHRQDRFIVRSYSPMTTIGGGLVIDPDPAKHRRFRQEMMAALAELESGEKSFLLQKLAAKSGVKIKELEQLSGLGTERIVAHLEALRAEGKTALLADQWATAEALRSWRRLLVEGTERFHAASPLLPGIPHATLKAALPATLSGKAFEQLLAAALAEGELAQEGEWVHLPDFTPTPAPQQAREIARIEEAYREAGPLAKNKQEMLDQPPPQRGAGRAVLRLPLRRQDRLVKLNEESFLHAEVYRTGPGPAAGPFRRQNETLTLAEFRDQFGSARKQVQALLEHFDGLKYTLRKGDVRVAWKTAERPRRVTRGAWRVTNCKLETEG